MVQGINSIPGQARYKSILELIGNTPLVEVPKYIHQTNNTILAKLEYYNPTKSLKDRIAFSMLKDAEERGLVKKDTTIIEPTSGNMGISLSFVCSIKGYRCIVVMSEAMSLERRKMIKHMGGELYLTPAELGFKGANAKAKQLLKEIKNSIMLDQHENLLNFETHKNTTGREIYEATGGEVDMFVAGVGTGGAISGVSAFIKEKKPSFKAIAVEPAGNNILSGGTNFSPHALQGMGSSYIPGNFLKEYTDEVRYASKEQAINTARLLAKKAGIICGISSGATGHVALQLAKEVSNKTICFIVASSCERYISTDLFDEGDA